jgi:hypothetical protein
MSFAFTERTAASVKATATEPIRSRRADSLIGTGSRRFPRSFKAKREIFQARVRLENIHNTQGSKRITLWQPEGRFDACGGRESGVVIPQGTVSDLSLSSSQTYLQIKEKALAIERLYEESNVPLAQTSELARLIDVAKALSDAWLMGQEDELPVDALFRVALLNRIAEALLPLRAVHDRARFLTALNSGNLDLLQRKKSHAKNVLWELELWSILKRRNFDAFLEEPPDIVVRFGDSKIGIACKKLYSDRHVQNVLSQAVAQIEPTFDFGIVAMNLDELVPSDKILRTPTQKAMSQYIDALNSHFLSSHERHFRKYPREGRLISAFISTGALADVYRARTRLNYARQSTVWTVSGLRPDKERALMKFYDQLMG